MTKKFVATGRRRVPSPAAMKAASSAGEWTNSTSALAARAHGHGLAGPYSQHLDGDVGPPSSRTAESTTSSMEPRVLETRGRRHQEPALLPPPTRARRTRRRLQADPQRGRVRPTPRRPLCCASCSGRSRASSNRRGRGLRDEAVAAEQRQQRVEEAAEVATSVSRGRTVPRGAVRSRVLGLGGGVDAQATSADPLGHHRAACRWVVTSSS